MVNTYHCRIKIKLLPDFKTCHITTDSVVLAERYTQISVKQNRKTQNRPKQIRPTDFQQSYKDNQ